MKVLLTGFETFDTLAFNPSEHVVRHFARAAPHPAHQLISDVLPTEYERAGDAIAHHIRTWRPDVVLGTGVAASRTVIGLERVALNFDDSEKPDNAGVTRAGSVIDVTGPLALETTCDIGSVRDRLRRAQVRCVISNHAGAYVCNHSYYTALRTIQQCRPDVVCLFVHLPMPASDGTAGEDGASASIDAFATAIDLVLTELTRQAVARARTGSTAPVQ